MSTDNIIEILNSIRENYEMIFSECDIASDCIKCKEDDQCFAYKAAKALGYAIKAVKSAQALSNAVERFVSK